MREEFDNIRRGILSQQRDLLTLKTDVSKMRDKMRAHLNRAKADQFDLKQSPGGMVDIEFIAQYLVLAHSHQFPELLTQWPDNLRIFSACQEAGLLTEKETNALIDAYCHIRDMAHRLTLSKEHRIISNAGCEEDRKTVIAIWDKLFTL